MSPEVQMERVLTLMAALGFVCVLVTPVEAIPVGIEAFDGPHTWVYGGGPGGAPVEEADVAPGGGPGGASDPYLFLEASGGSGPESRLSVINMGDWTGDYTAAGITQFRGDVNNFGPQDVYLRLLFVEFGTMGPVNAAFTTSAVHVAAGSGWRDFAFDITAADLTAFVGSAAAVLANTQELRIFHNPQPSFEPGQNPAVAAAVGLDNLQAVADASVPEPASAILMAAALVTALGRRRSARQGS